MKTTAVRLYGVNDLRLESFELPPIRDDEILVKNVSDSVCMSTCKAAGGLNLEAGRSLPANATPIQA
jgi:threonine dehydrogenase-like Zn-dependent dehydrogenase